MPNPDRPNRRLELADLTPEQRELLALRLRKAQRPNAVEPRSDRAPLSFTQQQLWFLDRLEPGTPVYNVPFALRLTGALDAPALHRAIELVVARHEALRTVFAEHAEGLCQIVRDEARIPMPVEDLRGLADADRERAVEHAMTAHAGWSFDLTAGPLLAVRLLRVGDDEHLLLVTAHHIVFDAWSADVFGGDLVALYAQATGGGPAELPSLTTRFADHVRRARSDAGLATVEEHLAHWRRRLADAPVTSTLPPDRARPRVQTHRGGRRALELSAQLTSQLQQLSRSAGVTMNAVVLSGLAIVLRRATGQEDIVIGMPAASRPRTELEPLIGCFANMLVLRLDLSGDPTVRELVVRTHDTVRDAYSHQEAPFARVVEEVAPPRDPSINPLFQVMVTVSGDGEQARSAAGVSFTQVPVDNGLTDFDVFITLTRRGDTIEGILDYNADLYFGESVDATIARLPEILGDMAAHADARVRSVDSLRRTTVALAATFTADLVRAPLEHWLSFLRTGAGVAAVPYGQMIPHLLAGDGQAASVCLLRWEDWLRHRQGDAPAEAERVLTDAMRDLEGAIRAYRQRSHAPLIVVVCPPSPRFEDPAWTRLFAKLDDRLALLGARVAGLHATWAADAADRYRVVEPYDARADELGHVPYTTEYSAALATIAARALSRVAGAGGRVVLVDERLPWREQLARQRIVACPDGALVEGVRAILAAGEAPAGSCVVLDTDASSIAAVRREHPDVVALTVPASWDDARRLLDHVWALDGAHAASAEPLVAIGSERAAHVAEHLATPAAVVERVASAAPRSLATESVVAPRTATEEQLAALWREALRLDEVGVTADFFALGGHSLLATQLLSRVQRELGAEISLYTLFTHPTIEQLAGVLDAGGSVAERMTAAPTGAALVPSSTQERLWALAQFDDDVVRHNTSFAVALRGALDEPALRRAVAAVVRCHEALRTTFAARDGRPVPVIHGDLDCWVEPVDVSDLADRARTRAIRRRLDEHAGHAYDLAAGPLLRVRLLRTGPAEQLLMVGMHHIICDNTSWNVFLEDLVAAYDAFVAGAPSPLTPPPVGFTDVAHHQREWLRGEGVERHAAFWREQLRDCPVLELPTDLPRPAVRSDVAGSHAAPLPAGLGGRVRELARSEGVSPFAVLTAAFAMLLHERSGESDLVLGVPTAGREGPELERVIGCFTDLIALRVDVGGRASFRQLVRRAHATALDAYQHQRLPFANVVEALRLPRDPSRHPLFSCVLNVVDLPDELPQFAGLESAPVDVGAPGVDFDLFLTLSWRADELHADLSYSADLFAPDGAVELLAGFSRVLSAALSRPDAPIEAPRRAGGDAPPPAKLAAASATSVAIAASYPLDDVLATVRFWSQLLAPGLAVSTAAPGQVLRPLLDADGPLDAAAGGLNVVLLRWEHWLAGGEVAGLSAGVNAVERALVDLCEAIEALRARSAARLLVAVAPPSRTLAGSPWDGVAALATERLRRFCGRHADVEVVAIEQWAARHAMTHEDGDRPWSVDAVTGTLIARRAYDRRRPAIDAVLADPERLRAPAALAELASDGRSHGRALVLTSPASTPELRALAHAGGLRCAPGSERVLDLLAAAGELDPASCVVLCADEPHAREVRAAHPEALALVAGSGEQAVRASAGRLWLLDGPAADAPDGGQRRIDSGRLLEVAALLRDGDAVRSAVEHGLPRPGQPRRTAPRTDRERRLAAIWADLLRLDAVGIHDDFFEIGGDSLLAMRIVTSAAEAGIAITPRQLVRHPTIAELCAISDAVAGDVPGDAAGTPARDAEEMGEMPLTPAQQWFFDALAPSMDRPAHFNHPYYLELRRPLAACLLERAVDLLARHHDALRLRFSCHEGSWRQRYAAPAGAVPFTSHDLTGSEGDERERTVERLAADAQIGLDLTDGPTARALHVRLAPGAPDRLLIVAHHLVVDAVSRGILLDDLQTLCEALERGDCPMLPAKTTSYGTWALRLGDAATSEQTRSELEFWLEQADRRSAIVAPDDPEAGTSLATLATIADELSSDETAALHDVARELRVGIRDLLVWSVARAVAECANSDECTIATTGHGREDLFEELDLSRTVGWFQVLYPIRLRLAERGSDARSVAEIARQLATVPRNGIGYALLRYAAEAPTRELLEAVPAPRIAVNYMGTFGFEEVARGDELFAVSQAPYGLTEDGNCAWPFDLDVTGSIAAGTLRIELSYAGAAFRRERMDALLADMRARLQGLTRQHASGSWEHATASDRFEHAPTAIELTRERL
jgi:non-ribosomal peptide synthase protein (TIGR01720 family)